MRALLVVSFALLAVACQSNGQRSYLETDIFEDVPAPKGAVYLEDKGESFSYRSRTFRSARCSALSASSEATSGPRVETREL